MVAPVCRENDVLRDQLKQYVTMIQTQDQQQHHTQPTQEEDEPQTPTQDNSRGLAEASAMEEHMQSKLSEVSMCTSLVTPGNAEGAVPHFSHCECP